VKPPDVVKRGDWFPRKASRMTVSSPAAPLPDQRAARDDRAFLGHPKGLGYLAFCEAWERFSYYGMQTLLVLYMVNRLLLPGHVDNIAGFAPFRRLIESLYGPLAPQPLASAIFGLYAGFVYFTPVLGGLIADRLLGKRRTVLLGGILMAAGHFLMAFDASFLLALACLIVGTGCFKGNIAAQVGNLYAPADLRRADAFQIFLLSVQVAVIASPLVCGTLGELYGWHYGFAAAGVGMLVALAIYVAGSRYLPPDPPVGRGTRAKRPKLAPGEGVTIGLLVALVPVLTLCVVINQEIFNAYMVWGGRTYDFMFFGRTVPTTWLITLDAIASTGFLVGVLAFWRLWARRFPEPDEITKITIGTGIAALGALVLVAASARAEATGGRVSLGWAVAFHSINSIGFVNIVPVALALYTRAAPKAVVGTMIGVHYLLFFVANNLVGWLGGLLDTMSGMRFWLTHAAIAAAGFVLLVLFRALFRHRLAPVRDPEEDQAQPEAT
jgi:POT family proton-dependent oligopeptide transporter